MKTRLTLASAALVALVLSGCAANVNNTSKRAADVMNATQRVTKQAPTGAIGDPQHVQMATNIANGLVKRGYAKNAFVFVVGRTAYVAIDQKKPTKTDLGMKQKDAIVNAVKHIDNRVDTVYVSASPDAYHRFQSFAGEMKAGRPVTAVWNNFRTMVTMVFPTGR
ncbi:YhcN/YlaJ family sporulation lipoprotein [Alicyclobacillus fastidiosus]|uniref:YhcN/YlaJ family sporulation lipoprotein n=1 Tax=Alicyclobacillus fastidiosus TaxID=392011 RepID=A0ABY6ZQH5_9BACL|nr:YhcN/YlaJ family sporulation lipoprotein [Alicyclobacillus fastidiosus]WAH44366.1 YhcN/YlaJ family sporulation lipoprotein [Alicyclobacillus fastidiosus]GMA60698.1 lipoprotein YhcN [Alicyclobacillus fastidiosus]